MAKARGARVYPGATKEIRGAPVTLTEEERQSALVHVDGTPVLHWHGDIFDLPEGAARLASTELTPNQAFAIGNYALGLQFHLETYGRDLEHWFVGHIVEIAATPSVNMRALRADTEKYSSALERCGQLALRA
jgi:GMP synthase (glutamine-hydrolysing)